MKVYALNVRGTHVGIVAASSQKEAAKLFRTSLYDFRQFGGEAGNDRPDGTALALAEPGRVFLRCNKHHDTPWEARP